MAWQQNQRDREQAARQMEHHQEDYHPEMN